MRKLLLLGLLLLPIHLLAQSPGADPEDTIDKNDSGKLFHLTFKNKPSLQIGKFFRVDLRSKWHFDREQFYPDLWNPPQTTVGAVPQTQHFYLTRARFAVKGQATQYLTYEVERDMRRTFGGKKQSDAHVWKDVNVNAELRRYAQVKVGKFKLPFGMEENTPEDKRDFINQSRVTDILTSAREQGVMIHGSLMKEDRLDYSFGAFRHDGENTQVRDITTTDKTYVARVTGTPLRSLKKLPKTIRHVYLGFSTTRGKMVDGQYGLQGATLANFTYVERMFVSGYRKRIGAEASWIEGRFSLKGEYMRVAQERKGQGLALEDLPDEISRGWYVTGTWTILGKMKSSGGAPKNPFLTGKGFGAVEIAARFDVLAFYSKTGGPVGRGPRATTILPNSDREWTFGATWYLNHFVKLQANAQREWVADISKKLISGRNLFWTGLLRLQVSM